MELIDLIDALGEPLDHPKVKQHFREEKITKQPRAEEDEGMAYVQFPGKGYEMRFDADPGAGPQLFLSSMTAYPQGDAGHKPFTGKLPLDIAPGDTRDTLLARLGAPAFHNKRFNIDMWKLGKWDVVVDYVSDSGVISTVQVNVPRKK
jgi:hypothetical protein